MVKTLTGGMQRRLAIAQALAMRPRILLLDDPFAGWPRYRADMHAFITRLWRDSIHSGTRTAA